MNNIIINTEFKSVVIDGAKAMFKNVITKQFWLDTLLRTTIIDKLALAYSVYNFCSDIYDTIKQRRYYINDFEKLVSLEKVEQFMKELMEAINKERIIEFIERKDFYDYISYFDRSERLREHFQKENIFDNLLKRIVALDETIKSFSLEIDPSYVPLYEIFEEDTVAEPYPNLSTDLNSMLIFREYLATLLIFLSKRHQPTDKNAPFSIVSDIVIMGLSPSNTYGLRRFASKLLGSLSGREENCFTILSANGMTILKFYDSLFYKFRSREIAKIKHIVKTIGFKNYEPYIKNLPQEDAMVVHKEISTYRKNTVMKQVHFLGDFLLNLYKTNSYLLATASTGFMAFNTFSRGYVKCPFYHFIMSSALVLFVPNYKYNVLIHAITDTAVFLYNDAQAIFNSEAEIDFTPTIYDECIPSAESINYIGCDDKYEQTELDETEYTI
ncbi:hypothetical protein PPL_11407 [Heterostelium album PN500]|uniref:Uncharacterized protein n=1 Tax=Heterostelium pallidum (strain ATCC 26659 / Pp 5 / PN500) TaxID=670386 RepID=D3BTB4_HETP5|nr:hypothetical protein PPL_11407 [Heterostelium album PN500]EFA75331.1 hypothetical protein PPL_11407 [Heterostelium album PN500]|eukprot:XP_020427465.1 hypothetical protein PPL_11407 [Heterostelium album PN500]